MSAPSDDTQTISPGLDAEAAAFERCIASRIALPAWFIQAMDGALTGGVLPSTEAILALLDLDSDGGGIDRGSWDGRCPEGEMLFFAEEVPWCTVRQWWGWGLPSEEAMQTLVAAGLAAGGLVEAGCGCGYWSAVLRARGVAVVAADTGAWRDLARNPWTEITHGDAALAIAAHPDLPVLISWADTSEAPTSFLAAMQPGTTLFLTGPAHTTGSLSFWITLDAWFDVDGDPVPCPSCTGGRSDLLRLRKRSSPATGRQTFAETRRAKRFPLLAGA